MGRPMLLALAAVLGVMVSSWIIGEFLRQRKDK
jgi:hypothetical protein